VALARTVSDPTNETHRSDIASHKQDLGAPFLLCNTLFFGLVRERGPVFGYALHASQCFYMIGYWTVEGLGDGCVVRNVCG